jgi:hypothetical protein
MLLQGCCKRSNSPFGSKRRAIMMLLRAKGDDDGKATFLYIPF